MKAKINKIIRVGFVIALVIFMLLGILTVLLQIIGLVIGNGQLMTFADSKIFPYAVLGSTIAGFLSFVFPYTTDTKENKD